MIGIKQNLKLLYQLLNEVVIGKVYYGINQSDEESHSLMPFIVYQEINNRALTYADNLAIVRLSTIQITLVTEKKDPQLESKIEQVLGNNGFNYQMVTEYLNSDQSINRVYEIKMEVMP